MNASVCCPDRVSRLVKLRRREQQERKVAVVLFNFPPNSGGTGTAAHLAVFESLYNTLKALKHDGYHVVLPDSVDALRDTILVGNAPQRGTDANVCATIAVDDHVRNELWLDEIEGTVGAGAGQAANGRSVTVCFGRRIWQCAGDRAAVHGV